MKKDMGPPPVTKKKLINIKEFEKVARRVVESLEEEVNYLVEKKNKEAVDI